LATHLCGAASDPYPQGRRSPVASRPLISGGTSPVPSEVAGADPGGGGAVLVASSTGLPVCPLLAASSATTHLSHYPPRVVLPHAVPELVPIRPGPPGGGVDDLTAALLPGCPPSTAMRTAVPAEAPSLRVQRVALSCTHRGVDLPWCCVQRPAPLPHCPVVPSRPAQIPAPA
jgi:hypothetical protein